MGFSRVTTHRLYHHASARVMSPIVTRHGAGTRRSPSRDPSWWGLDRARVTVRVMSPVVTHRGGGTREVRTRRAHCLPTRVRAWHVETRCVRLGRLLARERDDESRDGRMATSSTVVAGRSTTSSRSRATRVRATRARANRIEGAFAAGRGTRSSIEARAGGSREKERGGVDGPVPGTSSEGAVRESEGAGGAGRGSMSRRAAMATAIGSATGGLTRPKRAVAFIELPSRLHNRYFLVRHGESVLDVRKQVLSNPSFKYDATFGLTGRGREQMREAARIILEEYDGAPAWLYTSNFQRSFQSALVLREELGLLFSQMRTEFSGLLDPRKMGALDFGPQSAWEEVWANDLEDPRSTPPPVPSSLQPSASVESCVDLYRRAQEAFTRLEATYYGEDVVIVSHQDTLSLFAAALNGTELGRHHLDYKFDLGDVMCVDLSVPPVDRRFSPTDLRGDYAVGDSAINYRGKESQPSE